MPEITSIDKPTRFQCRHIFTDGHRCGSPCLRNEEFCFYHHTSRAQSRDQSTPAARPGRRKASNRSFSLPLPEDRSAIQASIGIVLRQLAQAELEPRRAGLLLYGLQIASLNLPARPTAAEPNATVEEITHDPAHGTLAPATPFDRPGTSTRPSLYDFIRATLAQQNEEAEQNEQDQPVQQVHPAGPEPPSAQDFSPKGIPRAHNPAEPLQANR